MTFFLFLSRKIAPAIINIPPTMKKIDLSSSPHNKSKYLVIINITRINIPRLKIAELDFSNPYIMLPTPNMSSTIFIAITLSMVTSGSRSIMKFPIKIRIITNSSYFPALPERLLLSMFKIIKRNAIAPRAMQAKKYSF